MLHQIGELRIATKTSVIKLVEGFAEDLKIIYGCEPGLVFFSRTFKNKKDRFVHCFIQYFDDGNDHPKRNILNEAIFTNFAS